MSNNAITKDLNFFHNVDSDGDTRVTVVCPKSMNVLWTRWISKAEQAKKNINTTRVIEIAWDCLRRGGSHEDAEDAVNKMVEG